MTVSLSGRLFAKEQLDLTPKASGRIEQILVRVGDAVKAGQAIAKLDAAEGLVSLQRAEASLLAAKARLADAKAGTRVENLEQSKNLVADAQNKYNAAQKDYERVSALFKEGAISAAEVEKSKLQLDSATTTLQNQKEKLKLDQKGPTQSTVEAAEAQYKQAEADAALARLTYENLLVKSPIEGVIGAIPVTVGSAVGSNT
ncbi:biotin/lipoyl-binding protein, partial [Microbacteriaceae bacterium K1510]|nr:biotin/lipoyl-binding protein [Microbacteriaceae bacterium K1510]